MDKKICNKCGIEKSVEDFFKRTASDGSIQPRGTCKQCDNQQRKKAKSQTSTISDDLKLTVDEITVIKQIIAERKKISTATTPDKRIVKSFNISEKLHQMIVEHAKTKNVSISDILNTILTDFFKVNND